MLNNKQKDNWNSVYIKNSHIYSESPSNTALQASDFFKSHKIKTILELGGGQGRDTIYFAEEGFSVDMLDYSESAINILKQKVIVKNLTKKIKLQRYDISKKLPFEDSSIEACFSNMLYCSIASFNSLEFLSSEVSRVLKSGGYNIYSAMSVSDDRFETGIKKGKNKFEINGFMTTFFTRKMVEHFSKGFEVIDITELAEGKYTRKLFHVILKKE